HQQLAVGCTKVAVIDAEHFAIGTRRFEVLIWKVGDAGYRTVSGHIAINVLATSRDGRAIVTGDNTGIVLWNGNGDALGESRDVQGGVDKLVVTPDGTAIVGAGAENLVFVWDAASFHLRQSIEGHVGSIDELVVDPTSKRIATVSRGEARPRVFAMPVGR